MQIDTTSDPNIQALTKGLMRLAGVVNEMRAKLNEPQIPPQVIINVPEQLAPQITVNVPEQPAPIVNVEPQVTVNVPEQPAPVVNVKMPPRKPLHVTRDRDGRISGIEEK